MTLFRNLSSLLTHLPQDVAYALRMLRQSPAFTVVAVLSLALGIGANTALFSFVDAILLRWLPVQNPQELVVLARNPNRTSTSFNYPDYRYIRDHNKSYAGVIAYSRARPIGFSLPNASNSSQLISMSFVSGDYFEVLGVRAALGRLFNPADNVNEGVHPYAVLSHDFWKRNFGEDTSVVGRDVMLNGNRFQVIGVSGAGFSGLSVGVMPDIFVPIIMNRTFYPSSTEWNTRHQWWLTTVARLKPGVSVPQAEAEFNVLWKQILESDPERRPVPSWNKDYAVNNTGVLLPGARGYSYVRNETAKPLRILMGTVLLVLLIACANVANLLLARAASRQREIAVRLAIGAGRGRLIAQMLTESTTLGVLGGVAGLFVAWAGVKLLTQFLPRGAFPTQLHITPDWRLLGFAFGLALLTGILFGFAPAWRASRPDLVPALKTDTASTGGQTPSRWDLRRTLVSVQVALSLLLLIGAGLFVQTLRNLRTLDPGMTRESLLMVETNLHQFGYQPQRKREFVERLRDQVQRLPGVKVASLAAVTPLSGSQWNSSVQVEGYQWDASERPVVDMNSVSPRFFEAAGIPMLLGRDFRDSDHAATLPDQPTRPLARGEEPPEVPGPPRVAIVNDAFAQKFFRGKSPLGRRLVQDDKWNPKKTFEIVGVVANTRYFDLRKPVEPMIYLPMFRGGGGSDATLVARTSGDPNQIIPEVRRQVQQLDSKVSITSTTSMEDNMNRNLMQERFVATLGSFFGIVALSLAAIGLYGVMAHTVTRRTREIGIRMALGAEGRRVLWMVLRDALVMVGVGAVIGIPVALGLTRYAASLLFGVTPYDPIVIAAATLLLGTVTALAGLLPARRATKVDPMIALRYE